MTGGPLEISEIKSQSNGIAGRKSMIFFRDNIHQSLITARRNISVIRHDFLGRGDIHIGNNTGNRVESFKDDFFNIGQVIFKYTAMEFGRVRRGQFGDIFCVITDALDIDDNRDQDQTGNNIVDSGYGQVSQDISPDFTLI